MLRRRQGRDINELDVESEVVEGSRQCWLRATSELLLSKSADGGASLNTAR